MPRKVSRRSQETSPFVHFLHNDATYQIDPERRKVYRRFVEIETSKAAEIFSFWRSQNVQV
jgi:hypothetical protein